MSSNLLFDGSRVKSLALSRILWFESQMQSRIGMVRAQRYMRLANYYANTNLPPINVEQPLNINYFKAIVDKHVSFLWGEFNDNLVEYQVRPKDYAQPEDDISIKIRRFAERSYTANNLNTTILDASLNTSIYGDAILRFRWDVMANRVQIENILPEYFHCRWNPLNPDELQEVVIAHPIDRVEAYLQYGTEGNPEFEYNLINPTYLPGLGIYWEHWTPFTYEQWIDDVQLTKGVNPYMMQDGNGNLYPGIIPFIHIANMRFGNDIWGWGDAEHIMEIQDEINRRMADMGDIVNNFAHPIITISKFSGDTTDLPVGADAIWNLGSQGKAQPLEVRGNPLSIEYVGQLMQMMLDTASMPEVAFGRQSRGNGRAQSSATAIQLIMLPVVERARRKRTVWHQAFRQLVEMTAFITMVNDPTSLGFDYSKLQDYWIDPQFGPILPKDRLAIVNENISLVMSNLRSVERALEELDERDIAEQITKIQNDMRWRAQMEAAGAQVGGKNSDKGVGGSPANPGGPGASSIKPGALSKGEPGIDPASPSLQGYDSE